MARWKLKMGSLILLFLLTGSTLSAGCAGRQQVDRAERAEAAEQEGLRRASAYGHPFRLIAFVVHPVGVLVDFVVVRPIYYIASLAPSLFGYTAEDRTAVERERKAD